MNMLKRLQDSLKSGKNDPFPSPFNTSAFSNSSSSLNINRLSPRTAKRKGKNKQHDGDNNEEEEESNDDEDGGRIYRSSSRIKGKMKQKKQIQRIKSETQIGKRQMKAKADEDEYPFYCLVGNQYYECNIEGKHTQFANSYLCYGPNPNGTEWEDYIEASKFVCKYDNVPLPSHSITQKRIWDEDSSGSSSSRISEFIKREEKKTKQMKKKKKKIVMKRKRISSAAMQRSVRIKPVRLNESIIVQYTKYLYRRMFIWCVQHPDDALKRIIYKDGTMHKSLKEVQAKFSVKNIPRNDLLSGAKSGNAYRHLDSGTRNLGIAIREKIGIKDEDGDVPIVASKKQIGEALCFCIFDMAGFKQNVIKNGFASLSNFKITRKLKGHDDSIEDLIAIRDDINKRWENLPLIACMPSSLDEMKIFRLFLNYMHKLSRDYDDYGEKLFKANFQTQGYRWKEYLDQFMVQETINDVVEYICNTDTWVEAVDYLQRTFSGVGPYTAAQAMCTLFYGVFKGNEGLFKKHDKVFLSMKDNTRNGPGPRKSIQAMYGMRASFNDKVHTLCNDVEIQFKKLNLKFPYLKSKDGTRRLLTCVDHEHSLCYFHRYLTSMKTLGKNGARKVHERFQTKEFKKYVRLRGLKYWEGKSPSNIDAFLDSLLRHDKEAAGVSKADGKEDNEEEEEEEEEEETVDETTDEEQVDEENIDDDDKEMVVDEEEKSLNLDTGVRKDSIYTYTFVDPGSFGLSINVDNGTILESVTDEVEIGSKLIRIGSWEIGENEYNSDRFWENIRSTVRPLTLTFKR